MHFLLSLHQISHTMILDGSLPASSENCHICDTICMRRRLQQKLPRKVLFRLAALLLIELRNAFTPDFEEILSSFPDNLFGVYSRFLKHIHPTAVFYVSAVLRWITFSSYPITMARLEDALAFDFSNPSEFVYNLTRRGEHADRVCKLLEGIIVVNQQWDSWGKLNRRVVSLAHASVKDYFRSERFTQEYTAYNLGAGHSHRFLAQTCLGYLLHFANHPLTPETRQTYVLGQYTAEKWYYHLHQSDNPALLSSLVARLLQDGSSQYAAFDNFRPHLWIQFQVTKPLSVCSELGYTDVRFLLRNGADPNLDDNGFTPLIVASLHGRLDIVRILLQSGAKVNIVALEQAHKRGHLDIIQVLLQKSSIPIGRQWATKELVLACHKKCSLEIVWILLKTSMILGGAQVHLRPLMLVASERGYSDVVRLLLEHGADVNATTEKYNPLCAASLHGHADTIRVLLEKGAKVNATSNIYGNALQAASHRGNMECVQLLLKHGANVNATGGRCGSTLQTASLEGIIESLQLLPENGVDVCPKQRYTEVVRLLLQSDADGSDPSTNYHGSTVLRTASVGGHLDVVHILLQHGAKVDVHRQWSHMWSQPRLDMRPRRRQRLATSRQIPGLQVLSQMGPVWVQFHLAASFSAQMVNSTASSARTAFQKFWLSASNDPLNKTPIIV
ncbi:ankyrin repeat-containing domain protein [Mycena olivaceomarginata]|nr:ankyrin repeat-containing domain protein [Mycena olivaceomarginata]